MYSLPSLFHPLKRSSLHSRRSGQCWLCDFLWDGRRALWFGHALPACLERTTRYCCPLVPSFIASDDSRLLDWKLETSIMASLSVQHVSAILQPDPWIQTTVPMYGRCKSSLYGGNRSFVEHLEKLFASYRAFVFVVQPIGCSSN